MKQLTKTLLILVLLTSALGAWSQNKQTQTTICNPMNLSYRFCLDAPSRREAADPTMVTFKG